MPPDTPPASPARSEKPLRQALVRGGLAALTPVLRFLPWRAVLLLGAGLGRLACALQPRRRLRAREALVRAFGDHFDGAALRRLERAVFVGLAKNLAEIGWSLADPARVDGLMRIEGEEHLRAALARGRGAVLITGHLGSWELLAAALIRAGFPLSVIAREANDGRVNEFLVGLRRRFGVRTVLRGSPGAARDILRTLKNGEVLGCLIDQDTRVEGVFVDFFGRPAFTPTGPTTLALRGGAPVVLASCWREPDGRHRARLEPPLTLDRGPDLAADVARHTATFTAWLEARIREHPDQWVWIHRRWRRQPSVS
jgi:KDO2-lipid IV(A) lauroyltransferase